MGIDGGDGMGEDEVVVWKLGKVVELYYRDESFPLDFTAPYRLLLINNDEDSPTASPGSSTLYAPTTDSPADSPKEFTPTVDASAIHVAIADSSTAGAPTGHTRTSDPSTDYSPVNKQATTDDMSPAHTGPFSSSSAPSSAVYAWVKADTDRYVRKPGVRSIEDTRYQTRLDAKVEELAQVYCSKEFVQGIYRTLADDREFDKQVDTVWQLEFTQRVVYLYRMLVMYRHPLVRTDSGYHVPTAEEVVADMKAYFSAAVQLSDEADVQPTNAGATATAAASTAASTTTATSTAAATSTDDATTATEATTLSGSTATSATTNVESQRIRNAEIIIMQCISIDQPTIRNMIKGLESPITHYIRFYAAYIEWYIYMTLLFVLLVLSVLPLVLLTILLLPILIRPVLKLILVAMTTLLIIPLLNKAIYSHHLTHAYPLLYPRSSLLLPNHLHSWVSQLNVGPKR